MSSLMNHTKFQYFYFSILSLNKKEKNFQELYLHRFNGWFLKVTLKKIPLYFNYFQVKYL